MLFLWAIAAGLAENKFFSTVDPSYKELCKDHGILFDIIRLRKWVQKLRWVKK